MKSLAKQAAIAGIVALAVVWMVNHNTLGVGKLVAPKAS